MMNPPRRAGFTSGSPHRAWLWVFLFLSLGQGVLALDPSTPIAQYRSRTWKQRDGLPQNSAVAIAQDADGYLWVATFGGLSRFNGHDFLTFKSAVQRGFPTDRTISLLAEPRGGLWVGTEDHGATIFRGMGFRPLPPFENLDILHAICIVQGRPGQIFIGTNDGLFELREGTPARRWSSKDGLPDREISALAYDRDGGLWMGTTNGVYLLKEGTLKRIPGEIPEGAIVYSLLHRRDGSLWIGSKDGLFRMEGGTIRKVPVGHPEPVGDVLRLLEDREGSLWVGHRGGGLCRIAGEKVERYTSADGLPSDSVIALFEDREGSLWVGTDGGGLHQLNNSRVLAFGSPKIPLGSPVRCIAEDGSGGFWIGTRGEPFRGLAHLTSKGVEFLSDQDLAKIPGILSLYRSRSGTLWIGCEEIGVRLLKDGAFSKGPALPLESSDVLSFAEGPGGKLLIGTIRGLYEVDSEGAIPRAVPGTEAFKIQSILVSDGTTWLGTMNGLVALSPSGIRRWDRANGLGSNNVRALYRDAGGTLWVGTYGAGLYRLAGERPLHFGPESGLLASTVSSLAESPDGRLWMTDNDGIFAVPRRQLDALAGGETSPLEVTHLTEEDGMLVRECNGGSQPAGLLTSGGDFVAATINGIVLVRPEKAYPNPFSPPVHIEGLLVGGRAMALGEKILLPPSARGIEIRYAALSFVDPAGVRYKIRLEGSDRGWIEAGSLSEAHYTELRPGRYRFRVIAANASGVWNEKGATLDFRVLPHFYETWWFLGLSGAATLLAIFTAFRFRTGVLRRRGVVLETVVATRTAELQESREGLERKVEERTAALVSAREALEDQLEETRTGQRALEESEERFRSVFDNAPVGIFKADPEGVLVMANHTLATIVGAAAPSHLVGMNICRELCHVGKEPGSCLPAHASDATPYIHEVDWTRFDGGLLRVRIHVKPSRSAPDGSIHFEGAVEDITAIRFAQERVHILETAIETMDLGFTITDRDHRVLYCNLAEARMHGLTVEEVMGQPSRELGIASQHHDLDWRELKEPRVFRREGFNRRKNGAIFPVYLTSIPVLDQGGEPFCLVTSCQDLTEAKKRDSQLQEALREAVVGKLAAVVAHQVNTPLAAMKTRLGMLREDAGDDEGAQRSLDSLMKQVDKVAQTVRALLGFVRQRSLTEETTSLQEIIGSVARLFDGVFLSRGIHLEVALPEEPLRVQANAADIQEVFLNLFENHREALGRGNRVRISGGASGGDVVIRVEDDGPGLGPDPEKVFQPFYTTKTQGTGLGMPICRNICAGCGGTIVAENRSQKEGGGARFVITLPLSVRRTPEEKTP
jgi:PAS domain S-box-containing protein